MIKTVWLDNPPVNAINRDVIASLWDGLRDLEPETRVIVLRGGGDRAFSAGVDITTFQSDQGTGPPGAIQPMANLIEAIPVPVVAAIHGYCLGGGLELALACESGSHRPSRGSGSPRFASACFRAAAARSACRG